MIIIGHDTGVQTTPIYCTIIFTECKLIPLFGDVNDGLAIISYCYAHESPEGPFEI